MCFSHQNESHRAKLSFSIFEAILLKLTEYICLRSKKCFCHQNEPAFQVFLSIFAAMDKKSIFMVKLFFLSK